MTSIEPRRDTPRPAGLGRRRWCALESKLVSRGNGSARRLSRVRSWRSCLICCSIRKLVSLRSRAAFSSAWPRRCDRARASPALHHVGADVDHFFVEALELAFAVSMWRFSASARRRCASASSFSTSSRVRCLKGGVPLLPNQPKRKAATRSATKLTTVAEELGDS